MKKRTKIMSGLISLVIIGLLVSPMVLADSSNVTVTWIIPADISIQIQYPNPETQIVFDPGAKTFNDQSARTQTDAIAGMNITNNGNSPVQINFVFSNDWDDAGLSFFNCSVNDNTNATKSVYWTPSNETSANTTMVASLGVTSMEEFWFWSTGTDMLESAIGEDTETLVVYYVEA